MSEMFFPYGDKETAYLAERDKRLGEVIRRLGHIDRPIIPDLFTALVNSIVGQQISTKAHASIWRRMTASIGPMTPQKLLAIAPEELRWFGLSFRKVGYIRAAAEKIESDSFDIGSLAGLSDDEAVRRLSELDGIGVWTAEMLLLHSLLRPDVLSYGDMGVQRGLRMVYHHRRITREMFERYRRRYSPYGSVACIYLWAVSGGAIEGMKDYAPKNPRPTRGKTVRTNVKA